MRMRVVGSILTAAAALLASTLLAAAPAQASEHRDKPAFFQLQVPALPVADVPLPFQAATVDLAKDGKAVSAQLWRYRYDCGINVSYNACSEARNNHGRAGWPTSEISWRTPGCTAPGVICPTWYFYYGH